MIVVGYRADAMRQWLADRPIHNVSVDVVDNLEYHNDNGVSVLKARRHIHGNFLLLMGDHIFEAGTARALLNEPLRPGEAILAVDPKLDSIFDVDDATKIRREGDCIVDIGKQNSACDALDTGMFLCCPALFDTLESAKVEGNCSSSAGMRVLARNGRLRAFDIEDASWQDVDTPEAPAYAESSFDQRFLRCAADGRWDIQHGPRRDESVYEFPAGDRNRQLRAP